jgi:hypothetical protein
MEYRQRLITTISETLAALANCRRHDGINAATWIEWIERYEQRLDVINSLLPSGNGIDSGSHIAESATPERVVIDTSFHHMHESGVYDGWTHHPVIIKASLVHGFTVDVKGRNQNNVKDYLTDVFNGALAAEYVWTWDEEREEYAAQLVEEGGQS